MARKNRPEYMNTHKKQCGFCVDSLFKRVDLAPKHRQQGMIDAVIKRDNAICKDWERQNKEFSIRIGKKIAGVLRNEKTKNY